MLNCNIQWPWEFPVNSVNKSGPGQGNQSSQPYGSSNFGSEFPVIAFAATNRGMGMPSLGGSTRVGNYGIGGALSQGSQPSSLRTLRVSNCNSFGFSQRWCVPARTESVRRRHQCSHGRWWQIMGTRYTSGELFSITQTKGNHVDIKSCWLWKLDRSTTTKAYNLTICL